MDYSCANSQGDLVIYTADPSSQFTRQQEDIESAVLRVLRSKSYILGTEVKSLEEEFANYIGTSHCIGVSSGTDAIELALKAINIQKGDEVVTVSHTAVATVAAIESAGATPILVDIDPHCYTINPSQLSEVITERTRAVIAVHLYGHPADLGPIISFCADNDLVLIEDCAQSHGALWNGLRTGSIGHIGCFSCYPTKNLGGIGDAGLITTNSDIIAERIRRIREYGWKDRYISSVPGRNARLDEIQAAILRVKLRLLDSDNEERRTLAAIYSDLLDDRFIKPTVLSNVDHVFHLYVIQVEKRSLLMNHLLRHGIGSAIHYPMPVHLQPAYCSRITTSSSMAVTEVLSDKVLSLPLYPGLSQQTVGSICNIINSFESPE